MECSMKPRTLAYDAARALPVYPRWPAYAIAILAVVTGVTAFAGIPWVPSHALLLLVVITAAVTCWWVWREVIPAQTTDGVMTRRGDREQRAGGVASVWDVMERASREALRRRAKVLRPSLGHPRRWRFDPASVGVMLARTGLGLPFGQQLYSACEDTTLRVGGPRTGKTLSLACHGLDAPGALVTTSTRLDLAEHVHRFRRVYPETVERHRTWRTAWLTRRPDWTTGDERAVHVFNPTGFGDVASTVRWSVLVGCEDYMTATRRAGDLIPANAAREGENWDRKARASLPVLLHAAAVSGRSMSDVLRWMAGMGSDATLDRVRRELQSILVTLPQGEDLIGTLSAQLLSVNDRTRSSVTQAMAPALAWMADPVARGIGSASPSTITLDIPRLIRERETLHIVGPDQSGGPMAPLTSALVAEVAFQARQIAGTMPGGRLDPPLTMLLDEAAVAVRLPLDAWSADMGGRGITLHMSVQSLSQLYQCWGDAGAGTLLGNVGTIVLFGGGKDAHELRKVSLLSGERWRRVVSGGEDIDGDGEKWEKVPVLTVAQLSNMPPGQAAVLQRNLGGVFVGWPPQVTDRRDWLSVPLDSPMPEPRKPARAESAGESVTTDTTEEQSA
jgi:type IV secretion system protein VirD4